MQTLCLSNFTYHILQLQRITRQFPDNETKVSLRAKKFTAGSACREDVERDDEFHEDSVLSNFKGLGFSKL